MKYDLNLTWNRLLEDPEALALVKAHLPELEGVILQYPQAARISIAAVRRYSPALFTDEKIHALETALMVYGRGRGLTPAEQEKVSKYQQMEAERQKAAKNTYFASAQRYEAFHPGQPWLDTRGKRIQAHAGAIFDEDGVYYWYGENKEFTTGGNGIWTWGIRAYRSTDLYNWEDLGLIVPPNLKDPDDNLFPEKCVDRPHILRCEKTGKYVMWIKISGAESCFTVLQADALLGPYTVMKENVYPLDHRVGDFDLVKDEETGNAYLFMDADHRRVAAFRLAEDFLSVTGEVSSQYEGLKTPFVREGIALFTRHGRKYMITSGMSGYTPNQSDAAASESWEQSFTSVGDPHVEDESMASFNSQISQVFRLPGQDRYIAVADRWMPNHLLDGKAADAIRRVIAGKYQPELYQATDEEKKMFADRPDLERADTSIADYVWLPVRFENGRPVIRWHDSWRVEDL